MGRRNRNPDSPYVRFVNESRIIIRREIYPMTEPILRISISPSGMTKVDAPIPSDEDRSRVFDFYGSVLDEIHAFDTAIRTKRGAGRNSH